MNTWLNRWVAKALALLAVPLLVAAIAASAGAASAATTHPAGPATAADAEAVASRIDEFMAAQIEDSTIPGAAVAVVRGDRVLLMRGYGHDSNGAPVAADSLFRVASLSKSFTALAVMQLVEEGRLDLVDPVQQHLPQFQLDDPRAGQITVRELLDHTSGLTDAMVPELSRIQPHTVQDAVTSLRTAHLATTPGTAYSYHNPNYQVAARLVEVLSGEPFGVYLRRHVLEPAGMTASTSTIMGDDAVPGLPDGHVTAYGHAFPVGGMSSFEAGDGAVVSSVADMARWLIVNANGGRTADGTRLVSAHGMQVLHTPSGPKSGYALGWETRGPATSPPRVDHSGSLFTCTGEQAVWPRTRYGVVVLFNAGSPMTLDQIAITHGVFNIVEGTTPPSTGPHFTTRVDLILVALTALALTLGTSGVARAGRWARRRGTPVRRIVTLLPAGLVLVAGALLPNLVEAILGRDATWAAALYTWPALTVFILAATAAAAVTLLARIWHWPRHRGSTVAGKPTQTVPEPVLASPRRAAVSPSRSTHPSRSTPRNATPGPHGSVRGGNPMNTQTQHTQRPNTSPAARTPDARTGQQTGPPRVRTVMAGVVTGAAFAALLTMTVFAGAGEAVTTGAVLVGFAAGWAVMAVLGRRRSGQPQRWAVVPGVAMGLTGAALLATRPGAQAMDSLDWVWPPLMLTLVGWVWVQSRRSVPGRARWVLTPALVVLGVASVGALAGNIAVARDRATYPAAGKLYEVNGHRLHIDCRGPRGADSATVVLSNSMGGTSADWVRVMRSVAQTTRVCAFDRAGQGWSEEAASPRDGVQSAAELHTLLEKAGEHGPYVLAGYSTGGTYAMTYAARYPGDVAGMVLLDSSSPAQFTAMPAFPSQYQMLRRVYGPLSTLSRIGVGHLLPGVSPLPAKDAARADAVTSAPKSFRNQRDEVSVVAKLFRQAQALTTLGDRPLVVLTASETAEGTEGWTAAQDALAALSTDSVHRMVTSSHVGMVGAVGPAEATARAIGEVVSSVPTHGHLPAR